MSTEYERLNMDAGETAFFQRELEHVKIKTYDILKAPLRAFELIPVDSTAGAGAESITYQQYEETGMAKVIANYADDLPRADVVGREFVGKVKSVGNSYGYNIQEIRAAQTAGKPLTQRKSNAATRAQRETWNKIAFYGDAAHNLPGWLTNANIPTGTVAADGTGSATEMSTKTADQIIRDVSTMIDAVEEQTNGVHVANTVVMPIEQYNLLNRLRITDTNDTVMTFLKKAHPGVEFKRCNEFSAEQLAANGITAFTGDLMMAYERSPDNFTFEMPQGFEQFPVQQSGLEFEVPCHSRVAGVLVYYPLAFASRDGI